MDIKDNRYKEKTHLCSYDLQTDLFNKFDLKVYDVIPVRNVYMLSTDKGKKILKKATCTRENLLFINEAVNYISKSFSRVIGFTKTKEGKIFLQWKDGLYCVFDLIEGRECEFNNPLDIVIASEGIGKLHKASEGFKTNFLEKNRVGRLLEIFNRKIEELNFFGKIAQLHSIKSDFDKIFLENLPLYLIQAESALNSFSNSNYLKLCSEEDKIVVCHNDLAYHNILIMNEEAYFIDFDYAAIDLRISDLCNFINKVEKHFCFDSEKAEGILAAYNRIMALTTKEMILLRDMLQFPSDFHSVCRDYYGRRKEWSGEIFINKLSKITGLQQERKSFIEDFIC